MFIFIINLTYKYNFAQQLQNQAFLQKTKNMQNIKIIPFSPEYQADFKRLNIEWIEKYFVVEPHDIEQLDFPQDFILKNGGEILFAMLDEEVVGTVGMAYLNESSFELAKMAVSPKHHGLGIGLLLGEAALDFARKKGAKRVWLESNRSLTPAITMYQKLGFQEVAFLPTPYSRSNIQMECLEF